MNLPKVLQDLVTSQNNFDSAGYANCFSENAVVLDEGKTHQGRTEIKHWIEDANDRYQATMEPVSFEENGTETLLKAEVSGNFEGSPIVMTYHLQIAGTLIEFLKITG